MDSKNDNRLYHTTHIENLESILKYGMLSRKEVTKLKKYTDVADGEIINERERYNLSKYVPFHFYPNSPFEGAIKKEHGGANLVTITIRRSYARENEFKILPTHPLNGQFQLFHYDEGYDKINWEVIDTPMKSCTDPNAKQIKMAEALSVNMIDANDFFEIYCSKVKFIEFCQLYPQHRSKLKKGWWLNGN
ncbi:DarT ssDNA thymidine ADP-ribosyltransferase family protein [Carnobacterium divergens]|uniref:DarT ssDNA thymidine ADP-ribosyltransferase family protein n=1 Tax=Carnobacterium divergens TaxID=2748 RepID=UPI0014306C05|nr:DarT ssDNA thymidine ADP-ribosyltransferase family protein [Carnobacterium divergens]